MNDTYRAKAIQAAWRQISRHAPERFKTYCEPGDADELDAMARYLWNIKLCESLTPVIHTAEILLKNSIHRAMTKQHGIPNWYDSGLILESSELELLKRTYRDVKAKKKTSPNDIVAELSLKFWVNLLRASYGREVWRHLATQQFMPGRPPQVDRNRVETIFNKLRTVRNRAYHHEPIWYLPNLAECHSDALEAIRWFSERHYRHTKLIDDFPVVLSQGCPHWRAKLEGEMFANEPQLGGETSAA